MNNIVQNKKVPCKSNGPVAAVWKYDNELGIAYFCPNCKTFVCSSGICECGANIDLDLEKMRYYGRVKWN